MGDLVHYIKPDNLDSLKASDVATIFKLINAMADNKHVFDIIRGDSELLRLMPRVSPNHGFYRQIKNADSSLIHKSINVHHNQLLVHIIMYNDDTNHISPALFTAITENNKEALTYLIQMGADVNYVAPVGFNAVMNPAINDNTGVSEDIRLLFDKDITPLHCAAMFGENEFATALLEADANPHAVSANGNTALHFLAIQSHLKSRLVNEVGYPSIIRYNSHIIKTADILVKAGVDVDAVNADGKTALDLAESYNNLNLTRYFKSRKQKQVRYQEHPRGPMNAEHMQLHSDDSKSDMVKDAIKKVIHHTVETVFKSVSNELKKIDINSILKSYLSQNSDSNEDLQDIGEIIAKNIIQGITNSLQR